MKSWPLVLLPDLILENILVSISSLQGEEDMSHEYGLYDDYSEGTGNVYGSEGESDPHNEVTVKREVEGGVKGGGQRSSSSMKSSYQELSMPIKKEGMGECAENA